MKSIVVDTRAEKKKLMKDLREASLLSQLHPQPSDQPEHEGTTSSTIPLTVSTTLEPVLQTGDKVVDKDAKGNTIMSEATNVEEKVDEQ
jgi:hypothetical protein